MGDQATRLQQLRDRFAVGRRQLEAIPEIGLAADGQPYIREIAEALQSFAAWFGELTLDDMGLFGSAYRVHDAVNGLDAIVDWVGLHHSQQFAQTIAEDVVQLVERTEALDAAVSAVFLVKQGAGSAEWSRRRPVPKAKRDAIQDGIEAVASLAGHLGVRLQRTAVMVGSRPSEAATKPKKRRNRKGIGGRPEKFPMRFIREVVAARERDHKHAAKARQKLPSVSEWLWDYCTANKLDRETAFPPAFDGEGWSRRANRFWKAATKRLREAETNRH